VKAHQAEYSTKRMCELLGVSTSGYHAWLNRPPSARELEDRQLVGIITDIWEDSDRTYGAPRIHAELADDYDIHVGRKRVARLMRRAGECVSCWVFPPAATTPGYRLGGSSKTASWWGHLGGLGPYGAPRSNWPRL
jgi:hypothetical protein